MALSAPRDTVALHNPGLRELPVVGNVKIFQGALVVQNAGLCRPGRVSAADIAVGVAQDLADNTGGADSAITVKVKRGIFRFLNGTAGDAITRADIGANCYVMADDQVGKTNPGGNTRSVAGKIYDVDALGVWVEIA